MYNLKTECFQLLEMINGGYESKVNLMIKYALLFLFIFNISNLTGQEKPNVLMIVLDDLNDYVGVLDGHPQAKTPNIDRLAKEGVLFTNAHATCNYQIPSQCGWFARLYEAFSS